MICRHLADPANGRVFYTGQPHLDDWPWAELWLILSGSRLRVKGLLVLGTLACCWLLHTAILCGAFRPLAARSSLFGLPSAVVLAAEVSLYPMFTLRRQFRPLTGEEN